MRRLSALSFALCAMPVVLADQGPTDKTTELSGQPRSVIAIVPMFHQLLRFSYPLGFRAVFESARGDTYTQESVRTGETLDHWTEMITVSGARGLSADQNVTPQKFMERMASGFRSECPNSFRALDLGAARFGRFDAFEAVLSCGELSRRGTLSSESTLVISIKGERDYYTIQWAERGAPSRSAVNVKPAIWFDRLKRLSPIRLCPIVPGEPPPYVSCMRTE